MRIIIQKICLLHDKRFSFRNRIKITHGIAAKLSRKFLRNVVRYFRNVVSYEIITVRFFRITVSYEIITVRYFRITVSYEIITVSYEIITVR